MTNYTCTPCNLLPFYTIYSLIYITIFSHTHLPYQVIFFSVNPPSLIKFTHIYLLYHRFYYSSSLCAHITQAHFFQPSDLLTFSFHISHIQQHVSPYIFFMLYMHSSSDSFIVLLPSTFLTHATSIHYDRYKYSFMSSPSCLYCIVKFLFFTRHFIAPANFLSCKVIGRTIH